MAYGGVVGSMCLNWKLTPNPQGADWVPIVVVGNKSDLHIQRQVTAEEGKALQQEWNCAWIETSARHNENVAKAFELLIAEVEKAQNPTATTGPGNCVIM